ncbi:hypothetical protein N0B40_19830 [Chryseobacterium oranimense]|uniref:hypothetical protein n=1 Tax=Chryseobacterium oranimense TaxID=421058 RepID=UPI0021AE7195|nr:hypothetical protein [Chryseobacterium oranimense]UWX60624.1 hypothetical protein N0B40_19830 [Chryseobacterium oranimense]
MKKIVILFILVTSLIACKAQQTYPLNIDFEEIPQGSYLKDLNDELTPYIGEYKANFEGNEIRLFISKETMKFLISC